MIFDRRQVLGYVSALGIAAMIGSVSAPAFAQSEEELLAPQALPDMQLGSDDAPVTIVEYASMTCPHCAHFH